MNPTPVVSIQDEVLNLLLSSPTPQDIITFQASPLAQERLRYLLNHNQEGTLSPSEQAELEEASQINHFVTLLKARAHGTLSQ